MLFVGLSNERAQASRFCTPFSPDSNIFLFEHSEFNNSSPGDCLALQVPGSGSLSYDLTQHQFAGSDTWSDKTSSIQIPSGYTVTLYDSVSGGVGSGTQRVFTESVSYVGNELNDKASFVKIERNQTAESCPSGYDGTSPNCTPSGYSYCASENGVCSFSGTRDVKYGANTSYVSKPTVEGSINCNNSTFGSDPAPNTPKACYYSNSTTNCPSGQIMCSGSCQVPLSGPCPNGQSMNQCTGECSVGGGGTGGGNNGGGGMAVSGYGGLENPIGSKNLNDIINNLSLWLYIFSVPILALLILYGAFLMVTSGGEEEKYSQGIKIVKWGVIGFVLVLLSGAIAAIIRGVLS